MHESAETMSPGVLARYIEMFAKPSAATIKTAALIWESGNKDIDPMIVEQGLALAVRINAAARKIGSQTPLEALPDVTGQRGHGNDDKPAAETIALAEGYAAFLEREEARVREICKPITDNGDYASFELRLQQENALLKEFVLRHKGKVTETTRWRVPDWEKAEASKRRRSRRK